MVTDAGTDSHNQTGTTPAPPGKDGNDSEAAGLLKRERITDEVLPRRGTSMFAEPWVGIIFGGFFLVAGTCITLVGCKVIPVAPKGIHAPYWVLTAIGVCFAAGGAFVSGKSLRQARRAGLLKHMQAMHPDAPWLADYPWNAHGYHPPRWSSVLACFLGTGFIALFASPFNWVGFFAKRGGGWPFMIAAGLMDLLVAGMLIHAVYRFFQALKFGPTAIYWPRLPLRLGQPCRVEWLEPRRALDPDCTRARIRLVEEYFVTSGSGDHRSQTLTFDRLYEQDVPVAPSMFGGSRIPIEFTLPGHLPPTRLAADVEGRARPRYYLLTIVCEQPGIDFKEHYLLPLYK